MFTNSTRERDPSIIPSQSDNPRASPTNIAICLETSHLLPASPRVTLTNAASCCCPNVTTPMIVKSRYPLRVAPPTQKPRQRTFGARKTPGQRAVQPPGLRPLPPILVIPPRVQHGPGPSSTVGQGPGWSSRSLADLAQGRRPNPARTK